METKTFSKETKATGNMDKTIQRFELLGKDVKHQINFISDFYVMDFDYLINTLKEMKELQLEMKEQELVCRKEGYYWCKLGKWWDIYYWADGWYDGEGNSYDETNFGEINERLLTHPE